jgi:hypothetical protein
MLRGLGEAAGCSTATTPIRIPGATLVLMFASITHRLAGVP